MIEILIALVVATAIAAWVATENYDLMGFLSGIIAVIGCLGLMLYAALGYQYFAAEYKADIINREYQTNYSQIEVFYASNVIDTIREINRQRIEINGDLITGQGAE